MDALGRYLNAIQDYTAAEMGKNGHRLGKYASLRASAVEARITDSMLAIEVASRALDWENGLIILQNFKLIEKSAESSMKKRAPAVFPSRHPR